MAADPDWDMYGDIDWDIDWDIDSDDINETPTCILCGVRVRGMIHSQPANPTTSAVLFREDKWKHYRKAKLEHVMVPSKEVEERDFKKFPSMWSCMCRAIIKEPATQYFLSGITAMGSEYQLPYVIPKSPNMARIGGRTRRLQYDDRFIKFYAEIIEEPSDPKGKNIGFIVHAHCWALLNHIIPTALIESDMDKFVRVAREYWLDHDHKSWGIDDFALSDWKRCGGTFYPGFAYGCDIYKNPLIVPEIQKTIQRAIDRATKTKEKCTQSRCSPVPLEVAVMIAEWTCPIDYYTSADVNNLRNMLSAWQWTFPDWFWKRRLKEDIFVELKSLREADYSIDWQALGLDLMGLVSNREWYDCSGLPNRERVLGCMTAIKARFLEMS